MNLHRPALSIGRAFALAAVWSCTAFGQEAPKPESSPKMRTATEINALIDQLVFQESSAKGRPVYSPGIVDRSTDYRKRFEACQNAFKQLTELREQSLPHLAAHLKDERPSIHFRNHYLGRSVGDACYWSIYCQLQDRPDDYSSYGQGRKGRDGQDHIKPYWAGTPFDEAGGVERWLEANKALNYREKQIKCLRWLLGKEIEIGVPDATSYFENILPLEVRILQRRLENGEPVEGEWNRMRKLLHSKDASQIPPGLLPERTSSKPN